MKMKHTILLLFMLLHLLPAATAQDDMKKKDAERLVQIKPLETFYDSVLKKHNVFLAITLGEDERINVSIGMYSFNAVPVNDSDLVKSCSTTGLPYSALLLLIEQMKKADCFEVGNSGLGTERYEIQIGYKLRLGGKRLTYMFPRGSIAIEKAKKNTSYDWITDHIYREKYKQR